MGEKLFTLVLIQAGERIAGLTFIDKLNKLEKLEVIESAHRWREMRDLRNHLTHEYPDDPERKAQNLNQAYTMTPELLECLGRVVEFSQKH